MAVAEDVQDERGEGSAPMTAALAPYVYRSDMDPLSLYLDSRAFEQARRCAVLLSKSELVPPFFRGKPADCFIVLAQAARWKMDFFSVFQHVFVTSGKVGYEGKLIGALINADPSIETNLKPTYFGEKGTPGFGVILSARLRGETEDRVVKGTVGEWATKNEKWQSIPDQMLVYRATRDWGRRHVPHVLLGVRTVDEVEDMVDLEPQADGSYGAPLLAAPPTPGARLDDLAGQLKGRRHIDQPESPREPTSILEGQLRKSLDMLGASAERVRQAEKADKAERERVEAKAQREREAARTKMDTKGQLCLHSETQQLAGGQVVCRKCGVVLFEQESREPGQDG